SGNFQGGNPGDVVDLTVQQSFFGGAPPPNEAFTWQITSGDAEFANTAGERQISTIGAYADQGNGRFDTFSTARVLLGNDPSQTIVVEVQSNTCGAQGAPPAQFFEFINSPPPQRDLVVLAGDGVTARVGDTVQ